MLLDWARPKAGPSATGWKSIGCVLKRSATESLLPLERCRRSGLGVPGSWEEETLRIWYVKSTLSISS